MDDRHSVYRKIRYDRTYRPLGKMTWWRIVAGILLLLLVFCMTGIVSRPFAARGHFKAAERLLIIPSWMETYRPDGGASFSTYAVSCINNRLTDAARKASAQGNRPLNESEQLEEEAEEADAAPSPEDMAALREELRRALEDMREKLSAFECRVMTLWLQGYSAGEIGQMTGKSPRSVSNALDRARRKLRNEMNG